MCGTSSEGFQQSLGRYGEVHNPLLSIIFPVGSSLAEILAAHIIFLGGAFFVASFRASWSIRVCDVLWRVPIFFSASYEVFLERGVVY